MLESQSGLIALFLILLLGLVIPKLFRSFHLPFMSLLIITGAIVGPHGLNYIYPSEIIVFFGFLGMAFLMLMAGLETEISFFKRNKKNVLLMGLINGLVPFGVGFLISYLLGYSPIVSFVVGIIFISSSVVVIIPNLKRAGIFNEKAGRLILGAVLVTDFLSIIAVGIIFNLLEPLDGMQLSIFLPFLFVLIAGVLILIPWLTKISSKWYFSGEDPYEGKVRFVLVLTLGVLILFSLLNIHPIIAAFLAGVILAGSIKEIKRRDIYRKIHAIGYGLFIPVFFFIVGMEMNLLLILEMNIQNLIIPFLIIGLVFSKFISGYVSGRIVKLDKRYSLSYGAISIVKLTMPIAIAYAALAIGVIDELILTAILLTSLITIILGPILFNYFLKKN